MHDFVLIREYKPQDKVQCDELIKNYLMECSREAFMTVLFKEVSIFTKIINFHTDVGKPNDNLLNCR